MKKSNLLFLLMMGFALMLSTGMSCKGSKAAAWTPAGNWDFVVKNTPEGDVNGTLTLVKGQEGYTGTISTPDGQVDLKDVVIEGDGMKAVMNYGGYQLDVEGTFSGEVMKGSISMGYDSFPMTATRK